MVVNGESGFSEEKMNIERKQDMEGIIKLLLYQ